MSEGRESGKTVIVIRKKPKRSHGQSGGSWKVAYADFVTAMMAFFLVMWIMGMESGVRELIEGYFNDPVGYKKAYGSGTNVLAVGNTPVESELRRISMINRERQRQQFEDVRAGIQARLEELGGLDGLTAHVEILITEEGLRIELLESGGQGTFFELGSNRLLPAAETVLGVIARELERLENDAMIEGHTDAQPFGRQGYSNWELSVDRANAARRIVEANGLAAHRILEVRGYADRKLRVPDDPTAPANRRVTILLPFKEPNAALIRAIRDRRPLLGAD